jgi:hypothetical protein
MVAGREKSSNGASARAADAARACNKPSRKG